jgi:hypothetical protein
MSQSCIGPFELLGPKDWQLVAPSVRAGNVFCPMLQRPEGPAQIVAHLRRSVNIVASPALTDGATNCQSFGPDGCAA